MGLHIRPRKSDLGDGITVHRLLPSREKRMVGPFIFWDHMGPISLQTGNKLKVRSHPHIGLSTLTYLFSGQMLHRDSLGNEIIIEPGEVNWMTAGKGITHSERSIPKEGVSTLEGIQLWVALPLQEEERDPAFENWKKADLPSFTHDGETYRLIAGSFLEETSPVSTYSPLFYLNLRVESEKKITLPIPKNQEAAIYVVDGKIKIGDQTEIEPFELYVFDPGEKFEFHAQSHSNLMIFGGEPFPEGRKIWWNFVASDQQKIDAAKDRWKNGNFPLTVNETETIPLPSL